ncbi:hypothetical protein D3C86_1930300 [compost metagenome]
MYQIELQYFKHNRIVPDEDFKTTGPAPRLRGRAPASADPPAQTDFRPYGFTARRAAQNLGLGIAQREDYPSV